MPVVVGSRASLTHSLRSHFECYRDLSPVKCDQGRRSPDGSVVVLAGMRDRVERQGFKIRPTPLFFDAFLKNSYGRFSKTQQTLLHPTVNLVREAEDFRVRVEP
jgi:hypothetical protein